MQVRPRDASVHFPALILGILVLTAAIAAAVGAGSANVFGLNAQSIETGENRTEARGWRPGFRASSPGPSSSGRVGANALEEGGNAVDAAVAMAFALAVTHPSAGNVGGGGFLLLRPASGEPAVWDFRETGRPAERADAVGNLPEEGAGSRHGVAGGPRRRARTGLGAGKGKAAAPACRTTGVV